MCNVCKIHFDEFSCTCFKYMKTKEMCKHIHLVPPEYFLEQNNDRYTKYLREHLTHNPSSVIKRKTQITL